MSEDRIFDGKLPVFYFNSDELEPVVGQIEGLKHYFSDASFEHILLEDASNLLKALLEERTKLRNEILRMTSVANEVSEKVREMFRRT